MLIVILDLKLQCQRHCDYSNTYILVKGRIKITAAGTYAAARQVDERNKRVIFKNCTPFINCINNKSYRNKK